MDLLYLLILCPPRKQIGGSDQWGNITAGTDLIHRLLGREDGGSGQGAPTCFGLTFPLLVRGGGLDYRIRGLLSFPSDLITSKALFLNLPTQCSPIPLPARWTARAASLESP